MHTFYITGGNVKSRMSYVMNACTELHVRSHDIHRLVPKEEAQSIGIADVRNWQKELLLTPLSSPYTIGIIPNADLLTPEAQHALLKTLEEPPVHTKIYIESQTSASLLPTILSRCQITQLNTKPVLAQDSIIVQLCDTKLSVGQKMALLDNEISNKEDAKEWVTQAIHTLHANRTTVPSKTYKQMMNHLLSASQYLASNVSYRLAIDHLFLVQ